MVLFLSGQSQRPELFAHVLTPLLHRHLFPDPFKQIEHRQPKCIGNNLDGIDRRIRPPILDPAQVRLVEATTFPEHDLALASL